MPGLPQFDRAASVQMILLALDSALLPGETLPPSVQVLVGPVWDSFAPVLNAYPNQPRLQYLYTVRQCIDNILLGTWPSVTFAEGGVNESDSDISKNLQAIRKNADDEIVRLTAWANASQVPACGVMTTTQPGCQPPAPFPNPASGYYRGLPYSWPWDGN